MKKEVNSVLAIVLILIISLLLVGSIVFVVNKNDLSKFKNSNSSDNKLENNNEKEETYPKIENLDAIAKDFYDNFISNNSLLFSNHKKVFKDGNKFNVSNLSFDERMSIIYGYTYINNEWQKIYENGFSVGEYISNEIFKKYYTKLFGLSGYKDSSFNNNFIWCASATAVEYETSSKRFIARWNSGCGSGRYDEEYLYDKAEQVDNKIKLYVRVGYIFPDTSGTIVDASKMILYSDYERKNVVASGIDANDISLYKDKLNTLIYTLVKDNNNYVLESIEVVK